jgi:hypothetical protein
MLFEALKKVEFRVGATLLKKKSIFLKNDAFFENSAILDFWKKKSREVRS